MKLPIKVNWLVLVVYSLYIEVSNVSESDCFVYAGST